MKSKKIGNLFYLFVICCILFGIGSGVYFEFFDDTSAESNTINWKKGLFRIAVIISIVGAIIMGSIFALLAIRGKLGDKDDDEDQQQFFKNPKRVFWGFSTVFLGFVWLVYFIIQWPIYYAIVFVIKGFTG